MRAHRSMAMAMTMCPPLVLAHFLAVRLLRLLAKHTPSAQVFPIPRQILFPASSSLRSRVRHVLLVPIAIVNLEQ